MSERRTTLFIAFSDSGTIRKWANEPFEGASEYALVTRNWSCVVDGPDDPDPTCVIDMNQHHDCIYAKPGMCREDCEYWQNIPTRSAKP